MDTYIHVVPISFNTYYVTGFFLLDTEWHNLIGYGKYECSYINPYNIHWEFHFHAMPTSSEGGANIHVDFSKITTLCFPFLSNFVRVA